jgi:hypothetical protein
MLEYVVPAASDRKLRLFACARCRDVWGLLTDERCRRAIEVNELFADGLATAEELESAYWRAKDADVRAWEAIRASESRAALAAEEALREGRRSPQAHVSAKVAAWTTWVTWAAQPKAVRAAEADLLREVFGNPFRPLSPDPAWLSWNDGCVVRIARAVYDGRRFEDLPLLADALLDAGCDREDVLVHCRLPNRHVRGCWVVDALLGRA